jgi:hypothetical protein
MICPLDHEDADFRFGTVSIGDSVVLKICPKCGIVFAPIVRKEENEEPEGVGLTGRDKAPSERQILKWP